MTKKPTQTQDKYVLRLPDGLRDRIKVYAQRHGRSMNTEIVRVLEEAFPEPQYDGSLDPVIKLIISRSYEDFELVLFADEAVMERFSSFLPENIDTIELDNSILTKEEARKFSAMSGRAREIGESMKTCS